MKAMKNIGLVDLTTPNVGKKALLDRDELLLSADDNKSNNRFVDSLNTFVKKLRNRTVKTADNFKTMNPSKDQKAPEKSNRNEQVPPTEILIPEENDSIIIVDDISDLSSNLHAKADATGVPTVHKRKRISLDDSIQICHETSVVGNDEMHKRKVAKTSPNDEIVVLNSTQTESDDIVLIDTAKNENDIQCVAVKPFNRRNVVSDVQFIPLSSNKTKTARRKRRKRQESQTLGFNNLSVDREKDSAVIGLEKAGKSRSTGYESPLTSVRNQSLLAESHPSVYGNNFYNPNKVVKKGKRPIIIDGSNVAYGHGLTHFSTRGLEICINYFIERGHWVVAFIPQFRRNRVSLEDRIILDKLREKGHLTFTPSRHVNGQNIVPYDDRYIVQSAAELGGVIVSTDNYRDLLSENEAWRDTIENRLLMFTWVGDMLMFPKDPNGRKGPTLEQFLNFPS